MEDQYKLEENVHFLWEIDNLMKNEHKAIEN
jgi:hypothetical protein